MARLNEISASGFHRCRQSELRKDAGRRVLYSEHDFVVASSSRTYGRNFLWRDREQTNLR